MSVLSLLFLLTLEALCGTCFFLNSDMQRSSYKPSTDDVFIINVGARSFNLLPYLSVSDVATTNHLVSVSGLEKNHEAYFRILFAPGVISNTLNVCLTFSLKYKSVILLPILLTDHPLTTHLLSHLCPV